MDEFVQTIVVYHLDDEDTPYRSKLKKLAQEITLKDFKSLIINPPKTYKYFFKSEDADFGVVKEEISDDKSKLPVLNNRIEAWLVSVDSSSAHSDNTTPSTSVGAAGGGKAGTCGKKTSGPPARALSSGGVAAHHPSTSLIPLHQRRTETIGDVRRRFDEESACTSDTESTIAGLPRISRFDQRLDRRSYRQNYMHRGVRPNSQPRNQSNLISEPENTSFFESDDERGTKISYSTDITSVSRQYLKRRKKKRRLARGLNSKMSEVSSVTESSASLNIITVILNIEPGSYLGISIVGHSDYPHGDGGICVANIMKGGAVALDGRIEQGDMILQVNDIPFHNLSNDEAVRILQRVVKESRQVKLVVAKAFDAHPRDYLDFRQCEPVRPIDPGAWVAHTNALLADATGAGVVAAPPTPLSEQQQAMSRRLPPVATAPPSTYNEYGAAAGAGGLVRRPGSAATGASSNNSGSFAATVMGDEREIKLDLNVHSMHTIVRAMARADSGLEIKTRTWLKIEVIDAFMGSSLVDWLLTHVHGFSDRKDARKYASQMLKENYIKHSVNKYTFTEQCYYFINNVCDTFANMRLDNQRDDCALSDDHEAATMPPVLPPPPPSLTQTHTPPSTSWGVASGVSVDMPPPDYALAVGSGANNAAASLESGANVVAAVAAATSSISGSSGVSSGLSAGLLQRKNVIPTVAAKIE